MAMYFQLDSIEEYNYKDHKWAITRTKVKFPGHHFGLAAVPESYFGYWADVKCKA